MKITKNHFISSSLTFILITVIFFVRNNILLDPDIGWHIRTGQYILIHGIPRYDPFSYSMPSYPFINHEWLSDVLIFLLYSLGGLYGVSGIFAIFAAGSIWLGILRTRINIWTIAIISVWSYMLLLYSANRPLIFSWFFFSATLYIICSEKFLSKIVWILPLIILLWTNMHGSFPLGIFLISIGLLYRWQRKELSLRKTSLLLSSCLLATMINPYHIALWQTVWQTVTNGIGNGAIAEWFPAYYSPLFLSIFVLAVIGGTLIVIKPKLFSPLEKILYASLLLLCLISTRLTPYWLFIAFPVLLKGLSLLPKHAKTEKFYYLQKFLAVIIIILAIYVFNTAYTQTQILSEEHAYPQQAIRYLKMHPIKGHLLSIYNWGGYLLWKLPDQKDFVDGRMVSWQNLKAPKIESQNAFLEAVNIFNNKRVFKTVKSKYTITAIFIPISFLQTNQQLIQQLYQNNLHIVYQDTNALIFVE